MNAPIICERLDVSGSLPEPLKTQDSLKKFIKIVIDDVRIRSLLLKLVSPDSDCKSAEEAVVSNCVCSHFTVLSSMSILLVLLPV